MALPPKGGANTGEGADLQALEAHAAAQEIAVAHLEKTSSDQLAEIAAYLIRFEKEMTENFGEAQDTGVDMNAEVARLRRKVAHMKKKIAEVQDPAPKRARDDDGEEPAAPAAWKRSRTALE